VIIRHHRTQIKPVAVNAAFWETLSLSAGRLKSFKPATTKAHFIIGAQKNTVFGPTGWFMKALKREDAAFATGADISVSSS